jgi:DNA-binding transcriptional LysR family regulator
VSQGNALASEFPVAIRQLRDGSPELHASARAHLDRRDGAPSAREVRGSVGITNHRHSAWIGGCERCQDELITVCRQERFTPRIAFSSDDMVVVPALVAAGIGVTTLPGLALRAHRISDVHTIERTGFPRQIYAVTYGEPPDQTRPPLSL